MGRDGPAGLTGPPGPPGTASWDHVEEHVGALVVIHSQGMDVPQCPRQTKEIWIGYSLLYFEGNGRAANQDLGLPGSCLPRFNTMPFMFCENSDTCNYAARNDRSYWLSTLKPFNVRPAFGKDIPDHISRCAVCEVPNYVLAVHSQSRVIPECPAGFSSLWQGYSWAMHTGAGAQGGGQPLASPGSCLQHFSAVPFVECNGARGSCSHFSNKLGFWMAQIDEPRMFDIPTTRIEEQRRGSIPLRDFVSRCSVCMKNI